MAEGANNPRRVPLGLFVRRATSDLARGGGRETHQAEVREGLLVGLEAGVWLTAAAGGSQTIRFERFTLQASTSGGGT